jgi:hypothetical protein
MSNESTSPADTHICPQPPLHIHLTFSDKRLALMVLSVALLYIIPSQNHLVSACSIWSALGLGLWTRDDMEMTLDGLQMTCNLHKNMLHCAGWPESRAAAGRALPSLGCREADCSRVVSPLEREVYSKNSRVTPEAISRNQASAAGMQPRNGRGRRAGQDLGGILERVRERLESSYSTNFSSRSDPRLSREARKIVLIRVVRTS